MASIFGYSTTEEPDYKVLRKEQEYEVREYPPQIRASVTLEGGMDANMSPAFRALAGFIFGRNTPHEQAGGGSSKIAMTAPVAISTSSKTASSQKIAMTAPVAVSEAGKQSEQAGATTMSFIMPSQYKRIQDLPAPVDPRVTLHEVPAKTYAVIRFRWGFNAKRRDEHEAKLRAATARDGVQLSTDPKDVSLLGYNPPWTLPWCRRNEVAIPVVA